MSLLPRFFGKEELARLQFEVIGKDEQIAALKSRVTELTVSSEKLAAALSALEARALNSERTATENLARHVAIVNELKSAHQNELARCEQDSLEKSEANAALLRQLEEAQAAMSEAKEDADLLRANVRRLEAMCEEIGSLESKHQDLRALAIALDAKEQALNELHVDLESRRCTDAQLLSRSSDIAKQELDLSARKDGLDKRASDLADETALIEAQRLRLQQWAAELAVSQEKVDKLESDRADLDQREQRLAIKASVQEENHKLRLIEVRERKSDLRKREKELADRKTALHLREVNLKKKENSPSELEGQILELRSRLKECYAAKTEIYADLEHFRNRYTELTRQVVPATTSNPAIARTHKPPELEISDYDPDQDAGSIRKPPPSLRSNTPLTAHGYHVGLAGISDDEQRRDILRHILSLAYRQLHKVGPPEYMRQWGEAKSAKRVRCVAYHLSWNIGFQGAKENNELARQHWLADLRWLTTKYRRSIPSSQWPKIPRM